MKNFGWVKNPDAVAASLRRLPRPFFATSEAAAFQGDLATEVFLWKAAEKVLGHLLPGRNQGQVGSCVSFGTASAIEHTMLNEIMGGEKEEFKELCHESIYGGSRVEIGGGQISGDGSIGSWAAEFVNQWGVLARGVFGKHDLSSYSEKRCKEWGKSGVPDDLEPEARKHPVKTTSLIRTWGEAKKALASGYGIAICSDQGFSMTRDDDGFAAASGSWGHCMALLGYQTGKREGGFILNSWGDDAHTGPHGLGDPPGAGFWAEAAVIDGMLRQDDSWAFSGVEGFPLRRIHWFL